MGRGLVLTCVPVVGTLSPRARACLGNSCVRPSQQVCVQQDCDGASSTAGLSIQDDGPDKDTTLAARVERAAGPWASDTPDRGCRTIRPGSLGMEAEEDGAAA